MTNPTPLTPTPAGWAWVHLRDAALGVFDCPHSTPKLAQAGPYLVRTQDIGGGVFRGEAAARVSRATYEERIARAKPEYGDLLYSREGTYFGISAEVPPGTEVCLGQRMVLIRPDPTVLHFSYARYWLNSDTMRKYVYAHRDGSVAQRLNLPIIRSIPLPLPPLEEQRGIAATLGALDDKIESNRRIIRLASDLLDALSASLANAVRSVPLGQLATVERTAVHPNGLGSERVDHFSLPAFDDSARPERVAASTIMSGKLAVTGPSILVSRLNPRFNRTWWAVPTHGVRALASTEFACLTTDDREDLAAIWLAVRDAYFRSELVRRASGTSGSHQRVRPDDLLAIEVPDVREISPTLKRTALALLDSIHQRRIEAAKLAGLRDALLPQLLTGGIRVPEATKALEGLA